MSSILLLQTNPARNTGKETQKLLLCPQRIDSAQAGEASEVHVVRAQLALVLDRDRRQVGVGGEPAGGAQALQTKPQATAQGSPTCSGLFITSSHHFLAARWCKTARLYA
jgi:hypothetical protein